ncbi:MAG: hypothetical protein GY906_30580 [bacterium]|nr:hypothetical protein [bacterium]
MTDTYRVKGSTLNSKLAFVAERFGESAKDELQEELTSMGFPKFFDSGWYSYSQYCDLLRLIADRYYGGKISHLAEAGEYSARQALENTYSAFANRGDFIAFLKHISMLHKMFYSEGRTEVDVLAGGERCEIRHREKPEFAEEDLHVALGFYLGSARLHGISNISGRYFTDALGYTFLLEWAETASGTQTPASEESVS